MPSALPRITVVCQCFNRKRYIGETIESVLSQQYPNTELIVIDDGSTDGSWEVIQSYKDRLAYCERRESTDKTPVPALNIGFAKSTGEIMTSLNDKNLLMPGSLATMAKLFSENPDVEWVTGIGLIANPESMIVSVLPIRKGLHEHLLNVSWNLQHESTFWRRSLWERTGGAFSTDFPWGFDADLWSRFFAAGATLYHLNTIVGAYRKLPTAHGVRNRAEYQQFAARARAYLRARVPKRELWYARLYRALRPLKPLLRNIPDSAWAHIPILRHLSNPSIRFKNSDTLERYERNPFRTVYPW